MTTNRCIFGHCIANLRQLAADGVQAQTCITSPPYWGLRDYGIPPVHWNSIEYVPMPGLPVVSVPEWDGCLGLEPDPSMFVGHMVQVFRAVREVLADDGTAWVNFGDSYAGSWGAQGRQGKTGELVGRTACAQRQIACAAKRESGTGSLSRTPGLKNKDLIGIPWRVAYALQADGWYLRQDIIWAKPNPMPESVTDRCTKAHEYLFLLSKSERYYYDTEAIKEAASENTNQRRAQPGNRSHKGTAAYAGGAEEHRTKGGLVHYAEKMRKLAEPGSGVKNNTNMDDALAIMPDRRNKRSVWTVGSKPYPGAHFATFPPALIEPCILAGSRPGDIVLDPFFGSGTTGEVAGSLGREWIGCEIGEQYEPLQQERTRQIGIPL